MSTQYLEKNLNAMPHYSIDDFFPTPVSVIIEMVQPVRELIARHTTVILEPSAGKGDILDYLNRSNHQRVNHRVHAIELVPELQMILAGKGYPVIGTDFLKFDDPYHFDVVLMNPPFSQGAKHALKAWDVVAPGGVVVCLLNSQTLENTYTHERQKLAGIVKQYGETKDLGACFENSERPTSVNVTMITLRKPKQDRADFMGDLKFTSEAAENEPDFAANPLAHADMLQALVDQYNAAADLIRQRHEISQKLGFYIEGVKGKYASPNFEKLPFLNEQLTELKHMFWTYVFDHTKIAALTTTAVREDFETRRKMQQNIAFTYENVMLVMESLVMNIDSIVQQCIIDAFDQMTKYHEKNKEHHEGWKTNKSWKIAHKVIVPYGVEHEAKYGDRWWSLRHYRAQEFNDLDKACCFLAGRKYDEITSISEALEAHISAVRHDGADYTRTVESTFFNVKMFKKGTVHITWKDNELRDQFNQTAAKGKGWVGPGY